ncbi:MAG: tetratricopeptide repeat protein, partial [Nitrospirales bacterium]|nr:tetratricopeptide repeat protein [Nitrospirales bacterium]
MVKQIKTLLIGIPLLVVSCGTAPQPLPTGSDMGATKQEVFHPQAYYHFLKGYLAEINNEGETASKEYRQGLNFDPDSAFLKFRLAKLYFSAGQTDKALEVAKGIPPANLSNASTLIELAKILSGSGDNNHALRVLEEGQGRFPDDEQLVLTHGVLLLNMKKFSESEAVFVGLLRLHPRSAESHYYLGVIAEQTGSPEEAATHYQRAIEANTLFERAYLKLIALWEEEKKPQKAIELLERYLQDVNPHHREFRLRLVRLYVLQHQPEKGLNHLDQLLQQHPDDLHAHVRKAQIYGEMKDYPAAIKELQDVLGARPDELRVRDFLG